MVYVIILPLGIFSNYVYNSKSFQPESVVKKLEHVYAKGLPSDAEFQKQVWAFSKADKRSSTLQGLKFKKDGKNSYVVKFEIKRDADRKYRFEFKDDFLKWESVY